MSLIRSVIGNQFRSNPESMGDLVGDYVDQRTGMPISDSGNITPKTTTISTDENGATTVTQKHTLDPEQVAEFEQPKVQVQQPPVVINPNTQMISQAPQQPVAPPEYQTTGGPQLMGGVGPNGLQGGRGPVPQGIQAPPGGPVAPQANPQAALLQTAANLPVVQGQQSPETFGRMLQAESGGRQFNPDGSIVTSAKGAQGIAQIMPATGANPGYGIAPATPQELATPEGNQKFGQRYFEGMYNKFGDPEKAAAAYNAGPGTIEKAMRQADAQGGTWKDYIPTETKDYLGKVFKGKEETQKRFEPLIAGIPTSDVGMTPTEQALHHIVLNSKDPEALGMAAYAGTHLIDPATKKAAADEHASVMQRNQMEGKAEKTAQDLIANGGVGLQRALKDPSEEGSYLKAYLFKRLGLNDLAKNEQQKLGAGDMWAQTMVDGEPAWVKYNGQGAPVKGYNATGELGPEQLLSTSGNLSKAEMESGLYFNPMQPESEKYALRKINGRSEFINVATNKVETRPEIVNKLTKMSTAGSLPMQAEAAYQKRGQGARGAQAAETGQGQIPLSTSGIPQVGGATTPPQGNPQISQANQTAINNGQMPPLLPGTQLPAPQAQGQQYPGQAPQQGGPVAPVQQTQTQVPYNIQKQQVERGGVRGQTVDKVIDTEYREEARAGDIVSNTRKQQFAIFDRPGINSDRLFGLYNSAAEGTGDQKYSIIRDIIGGQFKPEAEVSQRLAQLDLSPQEKSALMEYNTANQRINAATLKQNSGPGSISDSEQKANKEANVDITKVPALGAYNAMAQSQFTGDIARAKMDWAAGQNFANAAQMDKAWRKEQAGLTTMYADMAKQRAEWIAANGATTAAVKEGYKRFPIPEYDPNSESWKKTKPLNEIFGNKATR